MSSLKDRYPAEDSLSSTRMPSKDTRYSELRMRGGDYDKPFDGTDARRRDRPDSGEDHIVCNIHGCDALNPSSRHPARI